MIVPQPTDPDPVPYAVLRDPSGDALGLRLGAIDTADGQLERHTFNTTVWPLMSDLARHAFEIHRIAEVYR